VRALISVWDKADLAKTALALQDCGVSLVASGGTSAHLAGAGIAHERVEDLTGFPDLFGGRVKTLHPAIHGPILADRSQAAHMGELAERGWEPIDIVIVDLYPFESEPGVELVDIGGVALIRGAAKNFAHVAVLVDMADVAELCRRISGGEFDESYRRGLACKAFVKTSEYDRAIAGWLGATEGTLSLTLSPVMTTRYGENPHQQGALYRSAGMAGGWPDAVWRGSSAPSYLNIFDADGAVTLLDRLGTEPACVIVKHGGPCGVSVAPDAVTAYRRAFQGDPLSAFGGVVALNRALDVELAEAIAANPKCDVLCVPEADEEALSVLWARRKNVRVALLGSRGHASQMIRSVNGGYLVQQADSLEDASELRLMTTRVPSDEELMDAWMALAVAGAAQSNAIAIVAQRWARGIGQGQPSRVDAAKIAVAKANGEARNAAGASDAFFPFPDGLTTLTDAGVTTVVAPSGSVKDSEIVACAEKAGISLLFAPRRHFKH